MEWGGRSLRGLCDGLGCGGSGWSLMGKGVGGMGHGFFLWVGVLIPGRVDMQADLERRQKDLLGVSSASILGSAEKAAKV